MSDKTTCLDEITARLEAEPDGPDLCPVSECEVCTQVRDARAMLAVVREVAALHRPGLLTGMCITCRRNQPWPCPTARALEALTEIEGDER